MSGLENIISRLNEDSKKECADILSEAEAKEKAILSDAGKQAEKISADILARADKEVSLIESKAVSSAALEQRRALLEAKVALIDGVLSKAVYKLHTLDTPSYFGVLKILASKNALEGKGTMMLNKADLDRLPADFMKDNKDIEISETPADIKDGFILKYGDIEINCTFDAMMNASREEMKAIAGEKLFG